MSERETTNDAEFRRLWFAQHAEYLATLEGQCLQPISGNGVFRFCHNKKVDGTDRCQECVNAR